MTNGEDLSLELAKEIIQLTRELRKKHENIISNQLGRSATSVGANMREAKCAASKRDFLNKLVIAFKESNETLYWLELLPELNMVEIERIERIKKKAKSLHFVLYRSIKTTKENMKKGKG